MVKQLFKALTIAVPLAILPACTAMDAVSTGASLLAPAKDGIEANATVQLAKEAESNKNKVVGTVKADTTHHVAAEAVTYNQGIPWYVWAMVFMAWLIKDPIAMFFSNRGG